MAFNFSGAVNGGGAGAAAGNYIGGGWGAAIGGALGALGGAFGGGTSSKKAYKYSKWLMYDQYNLQKQAAQEMPSLTAEGYRKAGFNPALTVGAASGSTAAALGHTPGATNSIGSMAGAMAQEKNNNINNMLTSAYKGAQALGDLKRLENETNIANSTVRNTDAQTETRLLNNAIIEKYGSPKAKAELANIILDNELTGKKVQNMQELTNQIKLENTIRGAQAEKQKHVRDFYQQHPTIAGLVGGAGELKPAFDAALNVFGKYTNAAAVGAARQMTNWPRNARY